VLNLKYKQKYLKYKNKYLHIKLQIGGSDTFLWYNAEGDKKFTVPNDIKYENVQNKITIAYLEFLWNNSPYNFDGLEIKQDGIPIYYSAQLNFIEFDKKKLKDVIQKMTLSECMAYMEVNLFNLFNFENIDLISIGYTNDGYFENLCEQIFGVKILCFSQENIDCSLEEYKESKQKKQQSILLLYISSETERYKTIKQLKPLAFLEIKNCPYQKTDYIFTDENVYIIIEKKEKEIEEKEFKKKVCMILWINISFYNVYTGKHKFYKYTIRDKIKLLSKKKS